jgi:hypothetical protein
MLPCPSRSSADHRSIELDAPDLLNDGCVLVTHQWTSLPPPPLAAVLGSELVERTVAGSEERMADTADLPEVSIELVERVVAGSELPLDAARLLLVDGGMSTDRFMALLRRPVPCEIMDGRVPVCIGFMGDVMR